jgi:hypothetical protein
MNSERQRDLDEHLERFEGRLPKWAARIIRWVRQPSSRWVRIPLGIVLILGGIAGFLPLLGFWMLPLGLLLLAHDIPFLQAPLVRLMDWVERKWPARTPT